MSVLKISNLDNVSRILSHHVRITFRPVTTTIPRRFVSNKAPLVATKQVGVVIFPGFTVLDGYGPIQAYALATDAELNPLYKINTIGPIKGPIASFEGPITVADYSMEEIIEQKGPKLDVIVITGGMGTRKLVNDTKFVQNVKLLADVSTKVTSVCTGAALLAKSGILDFLEATSNKRSWDWVVSQGPHVRWIKEARWVVAHDKKNQREIVTAAGVSAGIDMSLAVIRDECGEEVAWRAAKRMEYRWSHRPEDDPFGKE